MFNLFIHLIGSLSVVLFIYVPLLNSIPGLYLAPMIALISVIVLQRKPDTGYYWALGIGSGLDIGYGTPGLLLISALALTSFGMYIKARSVTIEGIRMPFFLCVILTPLYSIVYLATHALIYLNASYVFSVNLWHSLYSIVTAVAAGTLLLWLIVRYLQKSRRAYER